MSFPCILQLNRSDDNKIGKVLDVITTLDGALKEECSLMTPVIKFEYPASSFAVANYMSIPVFNRQYFIVDVRAITATITEVSLKVDVLDTYASDILACTAIVYRNENRWNLYLDDGSFKTYSNPNVLTKAFPNAFIDGFHFVLAVAGDQ